MDKVIYITGASSQIGKSLRIKFFNSGYKVVVFSREKINIFSNETFVKYHLGDVINPLDGDYEHIVFHLAHDYFDRRIIENSNNIGLKKIIESFKDLTFKKIIFISTPDCSNKKSTIYTSQKKISESLLDTKRDLIIRPSLIFTENRINNLFRNLPKFGVPIPKNKNRIAPINLKNFSEELANLGINKDSVGVVLFCGQEKISLKDFIKNNYKIKTFYVHNFFWFILIFLFKSTRIPKLFYISERILGFIYLRDIEDLHEVGIDKKYV